MTYTVSSGTLNHSIPYHDVVRIICSIDVKKKRSIQKFKKKTLKKREKNVCKR